MQQRRGAYNLRSRTTGHSSSSTSQSNPITIHTSPTMPGVELWSVRRVISRIQFTTHEFNFGTPDYHCREQTTGSVRFQSKSEDWDGRNIATLEPGGAWSCILH